LRFSQQNPSRSLRFSEIPKQQVIRLCAAGKLRGRFIGLFFIMASIVFTARRAWLALALSSAFTSTFAQASSLQEPIIVTGSRTEQLLQTAPIGATVITAQQIERSGASDVNEAIRKLAGIAARQDLSGGRDYTLDLRGYGATADQNLVVLIDGVRMSENELSGARLAALPLALVERIEIVRGGSSVSWGEGASAGVINIVLKRDATANISGVASLKLGSFGTREERVSLAAGPSEFRLDAAATGVNSNGYRDNSAIRQESASFGARVAAGDFSAALRMFGESQGARLPGSLSFAQFDANPRQSNTPKDYGSANDERTTLNVTQRLGDFTLSLDAATKQRRSKGYFDAFAYTSASQADVQQFSPKLVWQQSLDSAKHTSVIGVDDQQWTYRNTSSFSDERATQHSRGVFAHTDWTLASATRLSLGTRSERFEKATEDVANAASSAQNLSLSAWEAAVGQTIAPGLDVYVRAAKSYRVANVDENRQLDFTNFPPIFLPPLKPQTARDLELGAKLNLKTASAALRIFEQRTRDEIAYDPSAPPFGANVNLPPAKRIGVEVEGSLRILNELELRGTLQSISAKATEGPLRGKELPLVPKRSGTLRVSYTPTPEHVFEAGLQYKSTQRFGSDYDNTCTREIGAAVTLDARYAWRASAIKGLELALSGTNLSDKRYTSYGYSCTNGSLYPEAGRAVSGTVSYRF
jgi:iron complex outermembrane recepter protein